MELLYRYPEISCMYPLPLRPRAIPHTRPDTVAASGPEEGRFVLADVRQGLTTVSRGAIKARVLADLQACGVVKDQTLIASHDVVLSPGYVHITALSMREAAAKRALLAAHHVHSIGRYGAWTYCSIEDNIVEARSLAEKLAHPD